MIQEPPSGQETKKTSVIRKPLLGEQSPTKSDKQNFFIDIRANQPPPQPVQPPVQVRPPLPSSNPLSPNFNSNNIKQNIFNEEPSISSHRQSSFNGTDANPPKMKMSSSFNNISENTIKDNNHMVKSTEDSALASNFKDRVKIDSKQDIQAKFNFEEQIDFAAVIELGHENFIKQVKNRYRNLQSICVMWNAGNIKPALDHAVNLSDHTVMADILNEINSFSNLWNLDICTILLPSIKDLINSRHEE